MQQFHQQLIENYPTILLIESSFPSFRGNRKYISYFVL